MSVSQKARTLLMIDLNILILNHLGILLLHIIWKYLTLNFIFFQVQYHTFHLLPIHCYLFFVKLFFIIYLISILNTWISLWQQVYVIPIHKQVWIYSWREQFQKPEWHTEDIWNCNLDWVCVNKKNYFQFVIYKITHKHKMADVSNVR